MLFSHVLKKLCVLLNLIKSICYEFRSDVAVLPVSKVTEVLLVPLTQHQQFHQKMVQTLHQQQIASLCQNLQDKWKQHSHHHHCVLESPVSFPHLALHLGMLREHLQVGDRAFLKSC